MPPLQFRPENVEGIAAIPDRVIGRTRTWNIDLATWSARVLQLRWPSYRRATVAK